MPVEYLKLVMEDVECEDLDSTDGIWWGTVIAVPTFPARSKMSFGGTLRVSEKVEPYSRIAVQAGLVLQDIPLNAENPSWTIIQKRRLEIVSEPAYQRKDNNQIILVTSSATTKNQFQRWKELLEERMHLDVEYLPISVYGNFDPAFRLPSGQSNKEAFAGRLVVVLDDEFNPSYEHVSSLRPSAMLPRGCMTETSGYDKSTEWLFVGSDKSVVEDQLDRFFTASIDATSKTFEKISEFKIHLKTMLKQERINGMITTNEQQIRCDSITIKKRGNFKPDHRKVKLILGRYAKDIAKYIRSRDKTHHYTVEVKANITFDGKYTTLGSVSVHRGYCRGLTSAHVILQDAHNISSNGMIFSVWRSIPIQLRIQCFCAAVTKNYDINISMMADAFGLGKFHLSSQFTTVYMFWVSLYLFIIYCL